MAITDWPADERPREKLLSRGAAALSDAELLAIFLRTGVHGVTAVDLARELLQRFGSLRALLKANQKEFCAAKGLGDAKFAQLQAVLEMARRHLQETLQAQDAFTHVEDTAAYLTSQLRAHDQEVFACLFLDNQHRFLQFEKMFFGTIHGANIHPREVVKRAMHLNAAAVILAHNHPSGVNEPSHDDIEITKHLKQALRLVDVRVLDHFIVGNGDATSLAQLGLL